MNAPKQRRDFLAKARALGFCFIGYATNGHMILKCPRGTVQVSATPSDWRTTRNELANLERISGRRLPRIRRGRPRKAPEMSGLDLRAARREREAREALREAQAAESERRRAEAARAAQAAEKSDRRRREIESLMRPGNGR